MTDAQLDEAQKAAARVAEALRENAIHMSVGNRLFKLTASLSASLAVAGMAFFIAAVPTISGFLNLTAKSSVPTVELTRDNYVLLLNAVNTAQDSLKHIQSLPEAKDLSEDIRFSLRQIGSNLNGAETLIKTIDLETSSIEPAADQWFSLVSTAQAEDSVVKAEAKEPLSPDEFRRNILYYVMAGIAVFGFGCLIMYLTTKDQKKMDFADNMLRTIVGFFIGITTGLLGLPSK